MIDEIVESSISHNYSTGSVGNYYYKISLLANRKIITIGDMTNIILRYSDTLVRFLLILLGAFVVVFLLVIVISNNLFQPIQDTLINQKKFLSDASHELKTPIAVISANADVIKNTEESEWINNIKVQTDRMKTLVADLLTLSALDENSSVKKKIKFNLSDEVVKVTLFFDALAYEKGKRIITDVSKDLFATGNPDSVRKITEILIDNAIKYATSGTDIIVSLKVVSHKTVLTVFNQGSNVPKSDAKKIFERFYRGEKSRSRELGGSGLGLSIAKSLAGVNKWKISARCELNEFMEIKVIM
jgi:signal transduction histidine kinase